MTTAAGGDVTRFPVSFDRWYAALSRLLGLPPATAYVELDGPEVRIRMGWAFRSRFPRSAIVAIGPLRMPPLSRGVHGFGGRWLVNGSRRGVLAIQLDPIQRAYVMGVPVRLRELMVSVTGAAELAAALEPLA